MKTQPCIYIPFPCETYSKQFFPPKITLFFIAFLSLMFSSVVSFGQCTWTTGLPQQLCNGGLVLLNNKVVPAGGTFSCPSGGLIVIGGSTYFDPSSVPNGNYTITYNITVPVPCSTTKIISVNSPIGPTVTGNTSCSGSSATLTASGFPNYTWYNAPSGGIALGAGPTFITGPLSSTTTFYVSSAISGTCTTLRRASTVTIPPAPTVVLDPPGQATTICPGASITFKEGTGITGYNYEWNINGVAQPGTNSNTFTYTAPGGTTSFTTVQISVSLINTTTFCTKTSSNFQVNIAPVTVNHLPSSFYYCTGGSVTLTASPTTSLTFQWYKNGTGLHNLIPGATSSTYNASTSGTYFYKATNASGCFLFSSPYFVHPAPHVSITQNPTTLSATPLGFPVYTNYKWYKDGFLISNCATCSTTSITGKGRYTLEVDGSCGNESDFIDIGITCPTATYTNHTFMASPSPYTLGSVTFDGLITIQKGARVIISGGTVTMKECTEIVIEKGDAFTNGGILEIRASTVKGCAEWVGFVVHGEPTSPRVNTLLYPDPHGHLILTDGTSVSDAHIAVYSDDGGRVSTNYTTYANNNIDIALLNYSYDYNLIMSQNTFQGMAVTAPQIVCTTATTFATLNNPTVQKMLYFEDIQDIQVSNCDFLGNNNLGYSPVKYGIEAHNVSDMHVMTNCAFDGFFDMGILLDQATDVHFQDFTMDGNYTDGFNMDQVSYSQFYDFTMEGEYVDGIYANDLSTTDIAGFEQNGMYDKGFELANVNSVGLRNFRLEGIFNKGVEVDVVHNLILDTFEIEGEFNEAIDVYSGDVVNIGFANMPNNRNTFIGNPMGTAIKIDAIDDVNITNCDINPGGISDVDNGVVITNSPNGVILINEFQVNNTGIYAKECNKLRVETNVISTFETGTGMEYYNSGSPVTSRIQNNFFLDNYNGLVVSPVENPLTCTTCTANTNAHQMNLILECNRFYSNDIGIVGSMGIDDQGSPSHDAGNGFNGNVDCDVLWKYPGGSMPTGIYYKLGGTYAIIDVTSISGRYINGLSFFTSDYVGIPTTDSNSCRTYFKNLPIADDVVKINVFPNPFNMQFRVVIDNSTSDDNVLEIIDIVGKIIVNKPLNDAKFYEVDASAWPSGIYFATVRNSNGLVLTKEVVKLQ